MRVTASVVSIVLVGGLGTAAAQDLRLVSAAAEQDLPAVRVLVDQGVDVNTARADGATALLWAAHWDDLDTARALLRSGASVRPSSVSHRAGTTAGSARTPGYRLSPCRPDSRPTAFR